MDLEFESWNRFVMRGFAVKTDVLGLVHRYNLEGFRVKVALPAKDKLGEEPNKGDRLSFDSWREIDGCKVPEFVWVHSVDVSIQSPKTISMPPEVLRQHANAFDLFTAEQQADLNKLTEQFKRIGKRALDVWVRTLRWKSNDGSIGRPEILDFRSGWSTYLRERKTKKSIWIATEAFFVRGATALTLEKWKETQSLLRRGDRPKLG